MKRRLTTLPKRGECIAVDAGRDERGFPLKALIVRTKTGELRAYTDTCKHIPIPIDSGSGEYMTEDGDYLFCGTHGALYRLEDGVCVEGPCRGEALDPVPLERDEQGWMITPIGEEDV